MKKPRRLFRSRRREADKRTRERGLQEREFAIMVAGLIHRAGEPIRPKYHAETFSLIGRGKQELHLRNAYEEYRRAPRRGREELLRIWVRSWFRGASDVPELYEDARSDLLPVIWRRGCYECELLEQQQNGKKRAFPCQLLGEHFSVSLAYDWPECKLHVIEKQLADWGVGFDQAIEVARENLRGMSREGLEEAAPGFWISPWHDDYDDARILLPDLIEQCEVKGVHVVMLPHKNFLLVTGSEDSEGLERMASLTEDFYTAPRFLSGIPLILREGWRPFELPKEHSLFGRYQSLRHLTMALDYSWQAKLLNDCYRQQGDLFVAATFTKPGYKWPTIAYWSECVDTLLPETAIIGFQSLCQAERSVIAVAEWDRVREVVGDLMEPVGLYPERYRVRSFPNPDQIEAIKGDGWVLHELLRQGGTARQP